MLHNYNVSFPNGSIITGQQLQLLHDQPLKYLVFQYIDYSDGVISGMDLEESDGKLFILPGMYKHNGLFYILENAFCIMPENQPFESGQKYLVYLSTCEKRIAPNIIDNQLQISIIKDNNALSKSSYLICSFYGNPQLPRFCKDIFSENFDLLSFMQSSYGKTATYSKYLFKLVYQYLITEKSRLHPLDYVLISEISKCGFISLLTMHKYIVASGLPAPAFEDRRQFFKVFINSLERLTDDKPVNTKEDNNACVQESFYF